ncbi:FdhD protein [Polaromonas sp. CG_9.5]|uniref:formate dehydrogenase accessory sulfurtransferase FdhD n=1 Tax=Polaromonas sp. CG_9.5 TaxID=3071705 RepID=UPI002DF9C9B5|nr:FdhD protein [Polaromonas sp. CG_9.5]
MTLPYLTQARAPLTSEIDAVNEFGERQKVSIPAERALTVYVDKRELVTLMTLGANPELLVLGYLRNQRLVRDVADIESITVDWEVGAAAVKTRHGIADIEEKTAHRVVTTGCGQGSVFGGLMDEVDQIALPADAAITQSQLYGLVNTIRLKETTYKSAGSVHACALFSTASGEADMLLFVEDVGRHNAIDTIAGWMWMNRAPTLATACAALPPEGAAAPAVRQSRSCGPGLVGESTLHAAPEASPDAGPALLPLPPGEGRGEGAPASSTQNLVFYTTGRLTSEMVIKSAQMGVPVVVSRSGITQMGHQVAQLVGLCAIGRATNKRFLCYTHAERLQLEPGLVVMPSALNAAPAAEKNPE